MGLRTAKIPAFSRDFCIIFMTTHLAIDTGPTSTLISHPLDTGACLITSLFAPTAKIRTSFPFYIVAHLFYFRDVSLTGNVR